MSDQRIFPRAKRQDPERQCHGKKRHRTVHDAKIAVAASGYLADDVNIYRCPHCGFWHLGQRVAAKLRVDHDDPPV